MKETEGKPRVYITPNTTIEHLLQMGKVVRIGEGEDKIYYHLPFWFKKTDYKGGKAYQMYYPDKLPDELLAQISDLEFSHKMFFGSKVTPEDFIIGTDPIPATNQRGEPNPITPENGLHQEDITQKEPRAFNHILQAPIDLVYVMIITVGSSVFTALHIDQGGFVCLVTFLWSLTKFLVIYTNHGASFFSKLKKWWKTI